MPTSPPTHLPAHLHAKAHTNTSRLPTHTHTLTHRTTHTKNTQTQQEAGIGQFRSSSRDLEHLASLGFPLATYIDPAVHLQLTVRTHTHTNTQRTEQPPASQSRNKSRRRPCVAPPGANPKRAKLHIVRQGRRPHRRRTTASKEEVEELHAKQGQMRKTRTQRQSSQKGGDF